MQILLLYTTYVYMAICASSSKITFSCVQSLCTAEIKEIMNFVNLKFHESQFIKKCKTVEFIPTFGLIAS